MKTFKEFLLESLEGFPKEVFGDLDCSENTKKFNKKEIQKVCKVHGMIMV